MKLSGNPIGPNVIGFSVSSLYNGLYFGRYDSTLFSSGTSTGSHTCVSVKPSRHTIIGSNTLESSAILYACIVVSSASWLLSTYSCIHPASLSDIESWWSFHILIGDDNALFATAITIGSLIPAAMNSISCISASPCDDVAVNVRWPVALIPIAADIALCSDSAFIGLLSSSPSLMYSVILSTICVCGVIGYIGITAGLHIFTASATAVDASITVFIYPPFEFVVCFCFPLDYAWYVIAVYFLCFFYDFFCVFLC